MTTDKIKTSEDLERYIEGILNDFENGTSKEETKAVIADLILKCCSAVRKGIKLNE